LQVCLDLIIIYQKNNCVKNNNNILYNIIMDLYEKKRMELERSNQILYNNNLPVQERKKRKSIILDIDMSVTSTTWDAEFYEPLIIDESSDIYLDTFITNAANISLEPQNSAFLLGINELNIDSHGMGVIGKGGSAPGASTHNKVLIPNNSGGHQPKDANSIGGGVVINKGRTIIHKANKLNYICQINPTKLYKLSGTITNLHGESIFVPGEGSGPSNGRLVIELVLLKNV